MSFAEVISAIGVAKIYKILNTLQHKVLEFSKNMPCFMLGVKLFLFKILVVSWLKSAFVCFAGDEIVGCEVVLLSL